MPAKDTYHDIVRNALIKDGWTITDDPLHLVWGKKDFFIDLGAERILAAEKRGRRIAVEVKSFVGALQVNGTGTDIVPRGPKRRGQGFR